MVNKTIQRNQRRKAAVARKVEKLRNATGNPENPAVPLDPDFWEEMGWMGSRSDAGVRMNHQQAIGHPPIWRAITLLARGIAKMPLNVVQIGANDDDAEIDYDHPAQYLLSAKPNDNMRAYTWKSSMMYHALLRGNGYSGIVRRGGDPIALILLDPTKTEPFWLGDSLWYKTEAKGEKRKLAAADVVHFKGVSWDGIVGHDILSVMANALGMGPAARKFMSKLLSRGSTAGGLLQLPRELSAEARKKRQEEFDKYQSGLDNAFKTLALEDGSKWVRTMITPQEAMIFEILGFDAKLVGNVFGIPAHKLGDDGRTGYASLEQENKAFLEDSLDPWAIEVETECTDKLCTEEEKKKRSHEVRMDRKALEMGDLQSESTAYTALVNGGLMLADEARSRLNLPPLPNGEGKKLRVPVNLAVDGAAATNQNPEEEPTPEPTPPGQPGEDDVPPENEDTPPAGEDTTIQNKLREPLRALVFDRLSRLQKIEQEQRPKAQAKGEAALGDFSRNHLSRTAEALAPILDVVAVAFGCEMPAAEDLVQQLGGKSIDEQCDLILTTKRQP